MKRIASFLALILFSAFTFAAVSITVSPNNVDFGEVSIKGKSYVQGETTLHLSWELPNYSQLIVETLNQPAQDCGFSVDGNASTNIWTGSGYSTDPFITSYDLPVSFTAKAVGNYSCKIHIYVYDPDNTTENIIIAEKTVNVSLSVTDEAIVPKTIPFERIETTSGLKDGDTIVFVCESAGEVSGPLDGAALSTISVTLNNGKAEVPEEGVQMFRASKYSGNWQFYTVETTPKRLHLDIVSNNAKGAFTYADTQAGAILATWGVEITNGAAVVSRPDDDQTYPVRWVSGGTGGRFKPYLNFTGSDIALYKKAGAAAEIKSKLEVGAIDFGTVELGEEKEVIVNYTGENLTDDIMWDITGTDKALFSVSPDESTDRTSGSVTVKYLGTALAVKTIDAKLYALTQDAASDDLEKEVPISITLTASTIKLTKIEFVGAPDSLVKGTSIDLKPYLKLTPDNAADKSLTWTVDNSYQGTVEDGVYTAKNVTGNVTITATSVKVPSVSASITLMQYEPKPASITLDKHEITTYIGETVTLQGIVGPDGASQDCYFTIRNKDILTFSKGDVTGSAKLTAKALCPEGTWVVVNPKNYQAILDSCLVKVIPVTVESVAFSPNSKELAVGGTYQLSPVVTPSAAASQYTASYESASPTVATVSETGLVTAVAEGTAEITCTIGGKSGKITISVVAAPLFTKVTDISSLKAKDTIILALQSAPVIAGARDGKKLTVLTSGITVTDAGAYAETACRMVLGSESGKNGFTLTIVGGKTIAVTSTGNDIVDANTQNCKFWEFVADGANGVFVRNLGNTNAMFKYHASNAAIKPYKETTSGAVYVYTYVRPYTEPVKPAAESVSLDQDELNFYVGDADVTLKATVTPNDADQTVIWESSNTDVATVSANGKVHAVAKGTATITAKVKSNESLKAECAVTVSEWEVTEVKFDEGLENSVEVGKTITVSATAYPEGHGFKVTYSSSDTEIATVSMDGGVVTGVAVGEVVIKATSSGKEATMTIQVVTAPVPEEKGAITVADFLKAKDDFNIYTLTGWVSNIKENSDGVPYKRGEFTLNDATGSIAIYGILTPDGVADKFWDMDIDEKDTVTLKGSYAEFQGNAEIKNATLVSVKKYVEPVDPTTGINNVIRSGNATKVLRQGQLIIIRDDKEYNAVGKRVK